jgi:NitT/TauT family transport system substrate-binding protein
MRICGKRFPALVLSALASTCALAQPTPLRLVMPHPSLAIGEEVYLYAVPKAMGFFKEEGLEVSVSTVNGSIAAAELLGNQGADIAPLLAESLIGAREQGGTPRAFYSLKRNNGFTVGVLPNSPIKSIRGLPGKRIGFASAGSGADKLLAEQLRVAGVDTSYRAIGMGTGPGVISSLRNNQVDALVMWEAIYAIYENQGMTLTHFELPLQDELAGYTLAATDAYLEKNPRLVVGYCRAVAKALYLTQLQPQAAVDMFFKEFPKLLPADKPRATAVQEGVNIMNAFLERAQKGVPVGDRTGFEDPARWAATKALFTRFGQLKGTTDIANAYTGAFFEQCNDFDRPAIKALADKAAAG